MASNRLSFILKSDLSELKTLNRNLYNFGQIHGLPEILISKVNICLDELFTNIVTYGFEDDSEQTISLKICLNDDSLILNIEDNGLPFNPLTKKDSKLPADIDNAKIGGLGIHIVKKLMDDIWYERKRDKNKLTMIKKLHTTSHLYKSGETSSIESNYFA